MAFRLGIDIGGTFTDAILIDEVTGAVRIGKVPSTPRDPAVGFMEAVHRMLRVGDLAPADISYLVHGTTVATNSIIEGKIARTGFITTEGFRDILEIARQIRPSLYDLRFEKPPPLVPRNLCFGVRERLDAQGRVITSLEEDDVRQAAQALLREEVESIAVCFLHAYVNPLHEIRTRQIIQEVFPAALVSLSAEVAPEFREYFRASTTVINAAIRPVVGRYLHSIETRLRQQKLPAELLVMQSSGGVFSFAAAGEKPVFMVESGPAAGVIASTYLGKALDCADVISFDMGGTTAKTALVQGGMPRITKDYEVGSAAGAETGSSRGSGYPIRTPVIDLVEIGAGGGSIAWVDSGGGLRVGPQSAGADPGPVCYGKGGTEPTITDANLLLGRLSPHYFLGGEMALDLDAARCAIEEKCALPLGLEVVEAAHGIIEIANAAMVNALRLVSVQRGFDPRKFALVAFGGAGPVHANQLAAANEIPTTLIPMSPGTFSALGLLVTDLQYDYSTTFIQRVDDLEPDAVMAAYNELEEEGRSSFVREGVADQDIIFLRQVDMRYVGQSYELSVSVPAGVFGVAEIAAVLAKFHAEHDRMYGFSAAAEPVEFVTLRLTATGKIAKPKLRQVEVGGEVSGAHKETRPVYFAASGGYVDCPIYDRYLLGATAIVSGPAIVEEIDSTTVIQPHYQAQVDHFGNLVLTRT